MVANSLLHSLLLMACAHLALTQPVWPHYSVEQEHFEVLSMRSSLQLNEHAAYDVQCLEPSKKIVFHDQNVAELSICGGIAGAARGCRGSPETTMGRSGSAHFTLVPDVKGATINISKEKWEQCVRAARAKCPTGSMTGMCRGGASSGDLKFSLDKP